MSSRKSSKKYIRKSLRKSKSKSNSKSNSKSKLSENVNKSINLLELLYEMKMPYRWWDTDNDKSIDPMYAHNSFSEIDLDKVQKNGLNCAGVINLVRLNLGLQVPGVDEKHKWAGGTTIWFRYLKKKNWLEPFDLEKRYPKGTLLIRNYTSKYQQGHVAVIVSDNKEIQPWENYLIHSIPEVRPKILPKGPVSFGMRKMKIIESYNLSENQQYTHVVLPKYWLMQN